MAFDDKRKEKIQKTAKDRQPAVLSKGSYFIMDPQSAGLASSAAACYPGILDIIDAWNGSSYRYDWLSSVREGFY